MIATKATLGFGLYTPAEAAFYARVHTRTLVRWLYGDKQGDRVIEPQWSNSEEKVVTFLDFVQAMAVRAIRVQYKLPLSDIRQAVEKARQKYDIRYPFAAPHQTFLFSDQKGRGHGFLAIRLNEEKMVQISGKSADNLIMKEIAEPFLSDLHFDTATGLAEAYHPSQGKVGSASVIFNPQQRFGEPLVMPQGYTVKTLFDAIGSEGSIRKAAKEYGVTEDEVKAAYLFTDHLKNISV